MELAILAILFLVGSVAGANQMMKSLERRSDHKKHASRAPRR
jgi:hypothetical protein